jgi:hypothetical protein
VLGAAGDSAVAIYVPMYRFNESSALTVSWCMRVGASVRAGALLPSNVSLLWDSSPMNSTSVSGRPCTGRVAAISGNAPTLSAAVASVGLGLFNSTQSTVAVGEPKRLRAVVTFPEGQSPASVVTVVLPATPVFAFVISRYCLPTLVRASAVLTSGLISQGFARWIGGERFSAERVILRAQRHT